MKTCVLCGKPVSRSNSKFCSSEYHTYVCMYCGETFTAPRSKNNYYYSMILEGKCVCSRSCGFKLRYSKDTQEEKRNRADKRRQTCIKKYGVDNVSKSKNVQRKKEDTCFVNRGTKYPTQSEEVKQKVRNTVTERYGKDNYFKTDEFLKKRAQTSLKKYGVDHPSKSDSVKRKTKSTCEERFGVEYALQSEKVKEKIKKTNLYRYGHYYASQSDEIKAKVRKTNNERYGGNSPFSSKIVQEKAKRTCMNHLGVDNPSRSKEIQEKKKQTSLLKYGTDNPSKSDIVKRKIKETTQSNYGGPYWSSDYAKHKYLLKTGYIHPSQNPEVRKKSVQTSSFERRVFKLLDDYNIRYEVHVVFSKNKGTKDVISHEYDILLSDYNVLIDCDGAFWHSNSDSRNSIIDYYDEVRHLVVPEGFRLVVIREGEEERSINQLVSLISSLDSNNIFSYNTQLFNMCRSTGFPYPEYSKDNLKKVWNRVVDRNPTQLDPRASTGNEIIKHFHKSLYDVKVGNVSIRQAWDDDEYLKKVILNRHIYLDADKQDPSRILQGFNISKLAVRASIFCPMWTKYLISKYLNKFESVFDPFSGFSGRMLGCVSLGKNYIGQDINNIHIEESKNISNFIGCEDLVDLSCKDVLDSKGTYECLLTSPPYDKKEVYGSEEVFMPAEDWVQLCLDRFRCKSYVFIVDVPGKFSNNVVETINHKSFMSNSSEYVLLFN